jgi:hypothetical protein
MAANMVHLCSYPRATTSSATMQFDKKVPTSMRLNSIRQNAPPDSFLVQKTYLNPGLAKVCKESKVKTYIKRYFFIQLSNVK